MDWSIPPDEQHRKFILAHANDAAVLKNITYPTDYIEN